MAIFYSTFQKARREASEGNSGAIANANQINQSIDRTALKVLVPAGLAVNDVIELAPAGYNVAVVPELSRIRVSNGLSNITVQLQLKPRTGAAVNLSAPVAITNAVVALAPAAATALPYAQDGATWQLLVTAATTVNASTEWTVELETQRGAGV